MGLHDLINDGQPQARTTLEIRLQWLKNLCSLSGVEPYARIAVCDTQPKGALFETDRERAPIGHCTKCIIAKVPEHLFNLVGVDPGAQILAVEGTLDMILRAELRLFFKKHQRLIQQCAYICVLKFIRFFTRRLQEFRNDMVQTL